MFKSRIFDCIFHLHAVLLIHITLTRSLIRRVAYKTAYLNIFLELPARNPKLNLKLLNKRATAFHFYKFVCLCLKYETGIKQNNKKKAYS